MKLDGNVRFGCPSIHLRVQHLSSKFDFNPDDKLHTVVTRSYVATITKDEILHIETETD